MSKHNHGIMQTFNEIHIVLQEKTSCQVDRKNNKAKTQKNLDTNTVQIHEHASHKM